MARDSYVQEAFNQVCKDAKQADGFYVVLMERTSCYGGPEEGGWYTSDHVIVAYQHFSTEEQAEAARAEVMKLAEEMSQQARRDHGRQCQREMEWLDARGLDADFLPEPDGPSNYYVVVSAGLPEESYGPTHYE